MHRKGGRTCVRLHLGDTPEVGLLLAHSMCGNGDVCVVLPMRLQQSSIVL